MRTLCVNDYAIENQMLIQDNKVKLSVVMPAYNAELYIEESITSILNQDFQSFELIILDDKSLDGTLEIILKYAEIDNRIRVYRNEINLGIAGNRNKGVLLAKGKYIVWQDADDISYPQRLSLQYEYMEKNNLVGISGGSIEIFNERENLGIRRYPIQDSKIRQKLFRYSPIAQPASIVRRNVLLDIGLYNESFPPAEDLDMTFRIGRKYLLGNIEQVVLKYRDNNQSATYKSINRMERISLAIRWNYRNFYKAGLVDYIFFIAHYFSLMFLPVGLKIRLFNMIRNSK